MVIIRLYYLSIRFRGESMGNLGGTSKKVPHPANPLHIGIPSDLWGMGNLRAQTLPERNQRDIWIYLAVINTLA